MLSPIDHEILKSLLLYQAILHYLENRELVQIMKEKEIESFQEMILECFKICKAYSGTDKDLLDGCALLLSTKQDISSFCPRVNDII